LDPSNKEKKNSTLKHNRYVHLYRTIETTWDY